MKMEFVNRAVCFGNSAFSIFREKCPLYRLFDHHAVHPWRLRAQRPIPTARRSSARNGTLYSRAAPRPASDLLNVSRFLQQFLITLARFAELGVQILEQDLLHLARRCPGRSVRASPPPPRRWRRPGKSGTGCRFRILGRFRRQRVGLDRMISLRSAFSGSNSGMALP